MSEGNGKANAPLGDCPEHPGTKLWGRRAGWCPECKAIARVEPDDYQADDLALLCDALAAIRRLSPPGRRALAVLMGE
jgi:hypothetical protein